MAIKTGNKAPDFTLPSTSGEDFVLSKTSKSKACVLYFYPKDFTSGCTKEACSFRDNFEVFENLNINIYGISIDSISTHYKFKSNHNLPFELLSDKEGKVSKLYKAHIPILNISKRVTYLLDENHIITAIYKDMFNAKKHIIKMIEKVNHKK
ncbi:MAG: peroxiredoxin [Cyclobacteriaceae bacterium]|nr:peroxiredoxin [Cyclobacteriaceae bacterium]